MRFICRNIIDDKKENAQMTSTKRNKNTYHHIQTIRDYLVKVYGEKCCYCESLLTKACVSFQVDHFYPEKIQNNVDNTELYVYDVRNFHVSCPRCNNKKKMYDGDRRHRTYTGPALSPNYYIDWKGDWQQSSQDYIREHVSFNGPYIHSEKYKLFFDALKLNGNFVDKTNSAALLERAHYLYKTMIDIKKCYDYAKKDKGIAKEKFDEVSKKFEERSEFSTMIIMNLGRSYIKLRQKMRDDGVIK